MVQDSGFVPDVVVGIREGGILPATVIATVLGASSFNVTVRRRASGVKHTAAFRLIGRHFGNFLYQFGFVRRILGALNRVPGRSITATAALPAIDSATRILVVDDFSCTGETFAAAGSWLIDLGANKDLIRTAALIAAPDPARGSMFFPTYMLANVSWVFFPWSSNSTHYDRYLRWKELHAL